MDESAIDQKRLVTAQIFRAQAQTIVDESRTRKETVERIVKALMNVHDIWVEEFKRLAGGFSRS